MIGHNYGSSVSAKRGSLLHQLAPSLSFAIAPEPDRAAAPEKRITILLGAGASMHANAPSTDAITSAVGKRQVGGAILHALRSDRQTSAANFEDVFHVLEQLDALARPITARDHSTLRRFLARVEFVGGVALESAVVRRERFEVMETIADAFADISYDASWKVLADLFRPLLECYNLDVFTLNYDLLVDVAIEGLSRQTGKGWFNGFKTSIRGADAPFNPNEYAMRKPEWGPSYLTLQHLHGSLRFAYADGDRYVHARRYVLDEGEDLEEVRETWAAAKRIALENPSEDFAGVVPLVSGLRKLEKLNTQPYANYFAAFAQAVSTSPRLLIVGYGKGDEHINHWVREFAQIHDENARIVEISDSSDPRTFAMSRITEWPDLVWVPSKKYAEVFTSRAGVHNLAITCGVRSDPVFPEALKTLMRSFFGS